MSSLKDQMTYSEGRQRTKFVFYTRWVFQASVLCSVILSVWSANREADSANTVVSEFGVTASSELGLSSFNVGNCTVTGVYITLGNSFGVGHNSETNTSHVFTIGYKGTKLCSNLKSRIIIKNSKGNTLNTIGNFVYENYTQSEEFAVIGYARIERRYVEAEFNTWSLVMDHKTLIDKQQFPQRHLINPQRAHSILFFGNSGLRMQPQPLIKKLNSLESESTDLVVNLGEYNWQGNHQGDDPISITKQEDEYFTKIQPMLLKVPYFSCPGRVLGVDEPGDSSGHRLDLRFKMPNCLLTPNSTTDPDSDDPVDDKPSAFYFDVQYKNTYYIYLDIEQIAASKEVDDLAFDWSNKIVELATKVHWIKWKVVVSQLPPYCQLPRSDTSDSLLPMSCVFLHVVMRRFEELF